MKKTIRFLSVVFCILLVFESISLPGSFSMIKVDAAGNYYRINGKAIGYDSVSSTGKNNNEYVKAVYSFVWDTEYTDDFSSSDNIIKNISFQNRALTAENLKTLVTRCQPGSVLKVEKLNEDDNKSSNGHEVFIVSFDSNGFTVFENNNGSSETYYFWEQFCLKYTFTTIRFIKWPNSYFSSSENGNETDYIKPSRALYYDEEYILSGDDVKWVQQRLVDIGYSVPIDGRYSKKTEKGIEDFQKDFDLNVTGIVDSITADLLETPVKKPDSIQLKLDSDEDLSRGDILNVSWEKVEYADSYHIYLYNSRGTLVDELDNITCDRASFVINDAGTYTIKGCAQNKFFRSDISTLSKKARVHNMFTVTFVDDDGTVLNKQKVVYGQSASTPASPKKTGYSFKGWDKNYSNITATTTVTAQYIKKSYTVNFVDSSGNSLCEPQKVFYGDAAIEPETSSIENFVGWDKDFSFVDKSITVTAITCSNYTNCYITISNSSAIREPDSSGYSTTFTVNNNKGEKIIGRAVVALKTTAGKFLSLTESSAFTVEANLSKQLKVFVPYSGAATIVEIYIVENYQKPIPISNVEIIDDIITTSNYTDWLTDAEAPSVYYSTTPYRTEYSYRTKSTTTSTASSLSGWTLYNTTYSLGSASGWSGWQDNYISEVWSNGFKTREVQTTPYTYVTGKYIREWNTQAASSPYYRHYWNYNRGAERKSYGYFERYDAVSLGTWDSWPHILPGGSSSGTYWGYNKGSETGRQDYSGMIWFAYADQTNTVTKYRYQDYQLIKTNHFYKWSNWSQWSTTPKSASDSVEVQTRQTRQYEVNDPTECNTGKARMISGIVDSSLAGKQATLFIYKIDEASDYTNEYIGQTVIEENGAYKFSFKLREEPSVDTGDFTVVLGVEGTNTVFYLDSIKAPLPEYTVTFYDDDHTVLGTQIVYQGESAVLPTENPTKPGYTFAGWDYSNASIYQDTSITALYVQNEYTVVFIDWTNERFEMQTGLHYGDPLLVPEMDYEIEGYTPICWEGVVDGMTVTENMVITAKYEQEDVEVNFYDYDNNIISSQVVKYGDSVVPPELDSDDEHLFLSWDMIQFDSIKMNTDIYPVYCFYQTVDTPAASVESGIFSNNITVSLTCNTDNSVIYYSINGEDEQRYTAPIVIDQTSTLSFYAASLGYNDSASVEKNYVINKQGEQSNWKYPVTINDDGSVCGTYIVDAGSTIGDFVPDFEKTGYDFVGYYTDSTLSQEWNVDTAIVNSALILFAKTTPKNYTVQFCYEDGTVIDTQSVPYLGNAVEPTLSLSENEAFIKWDSDAFKCVTEDVCITAIIRNKDDIATVTLNKDTLTTINGMNYQLIASISPEEYDNATILWRTSNSSVATVNDDGIVKAVGVGTAVISASISTDEVYTATCIITVNPNKDEDICLTSDSNLTIVNGKLLGVLPSKNTVYDVLSEIDSNSLIAYSSEGKELSDEELMETGSTICLVDESGTILDLVTVVVVGDVYADGLVNTKDASMLLRKTVNKETFDELQMIAADANADNIISTKDVSLILQYIKGMQTSLNA